MEGEERGGGVCVDGGGEVRKEKVKEGCEKEEDYMNPHQWVE
jgi:hypothetical protein